MNGNDITPMKSGGCGYRRGAMPSCAPLATSRVPEQAFPDARYEPENALAKGTLYPGLDLPFKNVSNTSTPVDGTRRGQLLGLDFTAKELQLYLDTHPEDAEALALLKRTLALRRDARRVYVNAYGPLSVSDLEDAESYTWTDSPWPWEYCERGGSD